MPTIYYDGAAVELAEDESVLDALLRHGHEVVYSCRSGACQSCLMRCTKGRLDESSQRALKPTLRERGYFLPCVATPSEDLHVTGSAAEDVSIEAAVARIEPLSSNVFRLLLEPAEPFAHRPGQFLNLVRPADGLVRSYSIASVPGWDAPISRDGSADSELLELHVRLIADGRMSGWIARQAKPGDTVYLRGPGGECFYTEEDPDQPMLLAGTGTGLAPLWGIARDALARGHRGPIALYHGAIDARGFYLVQELRVLAEAHPNLTYRRCVLRNDGIGEASDDLRVGPIDQQISRSPGDLAGWRVFLCGDPELVHRMRKKAFLAGASMSQIYADAFLTSSSPD